MFNRKKSLKSVLFLAISIFFAIPLLAEPPLVPLRPEAQNFAFEEDQNVKTPRQLSEKEMQETEGRLLGTAFLWNLATNSNMKKMARNQANITNPVLTGVTKADIDLLRQGHTFATIQGGFFSKNLRMGDSPLNQFRENLAKEMQERVVLLDSRPHVGIWGWIQKRRNKKEALKLYQQKRWGEFNGWMEAARAPTKKEAQLFRYTVKASQKRQIDLNKGHMLIAGVTPAEMRMQINALKEQHKATNKLVDYALRSQGKGKEAVNIGRMKMLLSPNQQGFIHKMRQESLLRGQSNLGAARPSAKPANVNVQPGIPGGVRSDMSVPQHLFQ